MTGADPQQRPPSATIIIGTLGIFAAAVAIGVLLDAGPGSYADWIAALATLAAFGAAIVAGWYAHRALSVEQARGVRRDHDDRDRERLELRAQAERIAA